MQDRILGWNPGAKKMYGWSKAEALAMNIRDLIAEPQREGRSADRGLAAQPI
jgi:two-component system, chemotaxis family, CheB/CheR fusion protein